MKIKYNKKKIRSILVAAGLASSLAVGAVNFGFHLNKDTKLPDFYYLNTKNIDLDGEDLLDKFDEIYDNSETLKKYWGRIYPELSDFILRYGPYLDQEELLDTLPNLQMKVVDKIANNNHLLAITKTSDLSIQFNKKLFYKKEEEIKEIVLHETFHYLFQQNFSNDPIQISLFGRQLDEGIASLLVREYGCYTGVDINEKPVNYVRVICELIGPENYMKATGHHDISELIGYISEYCERKDAQNLIKSIDSACIYYDSKTEDDQKAWDIINKIYLNKHGTTIEDSSDLVMKIYSNKMIGTNYSIEGSKASSHARLNKNYFVNNKESYITYIQNGQEYGKVKLNQNNEIESKSTLTKGFYLDGDNIMDNNGNIMSGNFTDYNEENKGFSSK